jgi:asparagine synthase (glutamine-hydrolysing)
MCGICGKYSPAGVSPAEINQMLRPIIHRGPDDFGCYVDSHIGLGSRRLSIIDLANGRQPISNEDDTIWIVFNGEIYNYRALRHELVQRGHTFRTNSDTEIIVHLYEESGERCVERLRGMFAFALWDEKQQKLFLARDHIGQKPLFYAQEGDNFLFGSEVKAILAVSQEERLIDYEALHHYLSLRFIPSPHTMLRHIRKLPPGHTLVWQDGRLTLSRYWHLSFRDKLELSEQAFIQGLRDKLVETVESHLVSDVPIGAFLSGGMDSSMIVALMVKDLQARPQTFAIGVQEQDFNELPYARLVAEQYNTCHIEEQVQSDLIRLLPQIVWHLDEPSDPIAACMFHAAALASQHVKVVLGGDGGDELFAGFDRYAGLGYVDAYAHVPLSIRRHLFAPALDRIPDTFTYKSLAQKLRWLHQLAQLPSDGQRYAEATCYFRFNHAAKQQLFGPAAWDMISHLQSADVIVQQFNQAPANTVLDRMLYADFMTRLPEHSLMLTDRMAMAHSLEARSPFLDHELVSYLAAFPGHLKIRGRQLKYILRELAKDYLPREIVAREKQGFMFPVAYWFRHELYPFIKHFLLDSYFVREGIFRKEIVERLLEEHRQSRVDHHVRLWMLLNLALWRQIYIEQSDLETVREQLVSYIPTGSAAYTYDRSRINR